MKTNQVTGKSKTSRISDADNNALNVIGANFALKEFMGPRADSSDSKADMYRDISLYGYCYQKDLSDNINEKQTLTIKLDDPKNKVDLEVLGCSNGVYLDARSKQDD